jgi:hypothetical protein
VRNGVLAEPVRSHRPVHEQRTAGQPDHRLPVLCRGRRCDKGPRGHDELRSLGLRHCHQRLHR